MPENPNIEKSNSGEIILYQAPDGKIKIDVRLEDETVWLTQDQMATLFGKGRSTIAEHIANVFKEGELEQNRTCRNFRQVHSNFKMSSYFANILDKLIIFVSK